MLKVLSTALAALGLLAVVSFAGGSPGSFASCVDKAGRISLPSDFRTTWVHVGSWAVPARRDKGAGFHDVYARPETVESYRAHGKFPDGAVLVKEIRKVVWKEMATGHVVSEGDVVKWFVMVRDDKGRFPENANWGDGWGWALFMPDDPSRNVSTDYKDDCLPCHRPAGATQLVYVSGYPALR